MAKKLARTKPRTRGRPPFHPTRAMRLSVERMLACGDTQETIAKALGIDDGTLRKHFGEEISTGAARRRRQVVDAIFEGVAAGNAGLIPRAEEITRAAAAQDTARSSPEKPGASAVDRRGKKEIRRDEAATAGGGSEWADDLKPLARTH